MLRDGSASIITVGFRVEGIGFRVYGLGFGLPTASSMCRHSGIFLDHPNSYHSNDGTNNNRNDGNDNYGGEANVDAPPCLSLDKPLCQGVFQTFWGHEDSGAQSLSL